MIRLMTLMIVATVCQSAHAQQLNIYSARHYETDEALYEGFTDMTGIRLNRLEGGSDELITRMSREGRYSPADILITVDAGRLFRAEQAGLFQPIQSELLQKTIPAHMRHPDGLWFGFSSRARMIFYRKGDVASSEIARYEDLADPALGKRLCIRSSSNIYNLSLTASMIHHLGEKAALDWGKGMVANLARPPQGGDTDQLRAVAAGTCSVAVANSYYFARLMASDRPTDKAVINRLGWIFPNQSDRGTHVNVSGAGVAAHAPNREAAIQFLEYLASPAAQQYFAKGNHEYPAVAGVAGTAALDRLGEFQADRLNVSVLGQKQASAQRLVDQSGWR